MKGETKKALKRAKAVTDAAALSKIHLKSNQEHFNYRFSNDHRVAVAVLKALQN